MTTFDPRLLTPPREEEEVYPYHRVWPSIVIQSGVLLTIALALLLVNALFGVKFSRAANQVFGVVLALVPAVVWLVVALWRERFAVEPRERLLSVFVITMLAANAVGVGLVEQFFQVQRWLPLASAINRILGYSFTVGISQEMLKFLVIRYTVWPGRIRARVDALAYGTAGAIGYATVLNLHFVFRDAPPPDVAASQVFANYALHIASSAVVAFGLAELHLARPTPFLLPAMLGFAAFLTGIEEPLRDGLVNATLLVSAGAQRPFWGILFSIALLVGVLALVAFLSNSAERQAREAEVVV